MAQKKDSGGRSAGGARSKKGGTVDEILQYRDKNIVVDTVSDFIFIGKLADATEYFITLKEADVHDRRESPSMNEKYILDAKKYGVRRNRKLVHVRRDVVISISLLEDVIEY